MLFNIISYYIMSQVGDSSTSGWQGWFTLKNSSTFCRVKADFILFGCRVGNLSVLELEDAAGQHSPWTADHRTPGPPTQQQTKAAGCLPSLPSLHWTQWSLAKQQQTRACFPCWPGAAQTSMSVHFCAAAFWGGICLIAIFKVALFNIW